MRALLAILALLVWGAPAAGAAPPAPEQLAWDHEVAVHYWGQSLPAGYEHIEFADLGLVYGGDANPPWNTIRINNNPALDYLSVIDECHVYVHEFGHLLLGFTYFALVNPDDPAHSPDPMNVMYGRAPTRETWDAQSVAMGCASAPAAHVVAARHHPRRHHRRWH